MEFKTFAPTTTNAPMDIEHSDFSTHLERKTKPSVSGLDEEEMDENQMLKLVCTDGTCFTLPKKYAMISNVIKTSLEDGMLVVNF